MKAHPLVSIIITTKNEAGTIGRLLKSIRKQIYHPLEAIVVDNHSTDQTKSIAKKFTNKVYNFGPERSAQRNYGVRKALGKFVLILDADMKLTPLVVEQCIKLVKGDDRVKAVVIPELSVAKTFWGQVKAFERSFYNKEGDPITDAARFFDKKIFLNLGGYDEAITGPEDWDLPERVFKHGFKIGRIKAKIYHYEKISSPIALARKKFYYALSVNRYLKKQKISLFSAKTIYFLRPVFYKNWQKLVAHPILSVAMVVMLTSELIGGGLGFIIGKLKND